MFGMVAALTLCVPAVSGQGQLQDLNREWARTQFGNYVFDHFLEHEGRRYSKEIDPRYNTYISLFEYKNLRLRNLKTEPRKDSDDDNRIVWRGSVTLIGTSWRQFYLGHPHWDCAREEVSVLFEIIRYDDDRAQIVQSSREYRKEIRPRMEKPTVEEVTTALEQPSASDCH